MRLLLSVFLTLVIWAAPTKSYSESIPKMNERIVKYVKSVMGTKVDRGECWDLAYRALNLVDAAWDGQYVYGRPVDFQNEEVYPGDIVHFKGVVVKQTVGLTTITETMKQHTAIIMDVYDKGVYELAHQNTSFSGRKVGTSPIDLNGVVKGTVIIYRPVK